MYTSHITDSPNQFGVVSKAKSRAVIVDAAQKVVDVEGKKDWSNDRSLRRE